MPTPRASISPAIVAGARATSAAAAALEHDPVVGDQRRAPADHRERQRRLAGAGARRESARRARRRPPPRHARSTTPLLRHPAPPFPSAHCENIRKPIPTNATPKRRFYAIDIPVTISGGAKVGRCVLYLGGRPCCIAALAGFRRVDLASERPVHGGVLARMTTLFKLKDEVNPRMTLEASGFPGAARVHYNLLEPALMQAALERGEGDLGRGGALLVSTGRHTGRSPNDKFVVREPAVEPHVWWENNAPMAPAHFAALLADMRAHVDGGELFVQDLYAGRRPRTTG